MTRIPSALVAPDMKFSLIRRSWVIHPMRPPSRPSACARPKQHSHEAQTVKFPVALPACASLETATVNLIRLQLLTHGIATAAEIERHLANVADGKLDLAQPPMITAWGRNR